MDKLREALTKAASNATVRRGEVVLHASDWLAIQDALSAPAVQPVRDLVGLSLAFDAGWTAGRGAGSAATYERKAQLRGEYLKAPATPQPETDRPE